MSAKDPTCGETYWFQADGTSTWDDPHAAQAATPPSSEAAPAPAPEPEPEPIAVPDVVEAMVDVAVVENLVREETPKSPMTAEELPAMIPLVASSGDDAALVGQIETAISKEHAAMESAPNAGVKTTHLKTEARLRRWHTTITSPDKDESSKALARNLAVAFLARVSDATSFGSEKK